MTFSSHLQLTASYITFLRNSHSKYGVHSPFVYELVTKVFQDKYHYPEYELAEEIRKQYLSSKMVIEISNYAVINGKSSMGNELKQIRAIARAAITPKCGRLLYRLVKYFAPETLLELGTSLGISTIYMASAAPTANFTTIENCATTAAIATESLKQAGLHHINMLSGIFSISLSRIVAAQKTIGFAYLDVNHTHKNTFEYFNQCLRASDENSIFVFRGIHRSQNRDVGMACCPRQNRAIQKSRPAWSN